MKKTAVAIMFLVLALVMPVSCSSADQRALIGRWEIRIDSEEIGSVTMVYHFSEDGEIFLEQNDGDKIPFSIPFGTWSLRGETLTIVSDGEENVFSFSVSETQLILSQKDQKDLVFDRV